MNLRDKRRAVKRLIEQLDALRLDALLTLLEEPEENLYVSEDDRHQLEYRNKNKKTDIRQAEKEINAALRKKSLIEMLEKIDPKYVTALEDLLCEPTDEFRISEEDWKEIDRRSKEVEDGKVKELDALESLERIRGKLKSAKFRKK